MIIVMYDGQCMFCEGWVKFVLRHIKNKDIIFVPIQFSGLDAANLLLNSDVPSMVVIDAPNNEVYFDAIASLTVMKKLGFGMGVIASTLALLPKFLVNYFYRLIGRNRHLIFGRSDVCELPSDAEKSFFVGDTEELELLFKNESVNVTELEAKLRDKYI